MLLILPSISAIVVGVCGTVILQVGVAVVLIITPRQNIVRGNKTGSLFLITCRVCWLLAA